MSAPRQVVPLSYRPRQRAMQRLLGAELIDVPAIAAVAGCSAWALRATLQGGGVLPAAIAERVAGAVGFPLEALFDMNEATALQLDASTDPGLRSGPTVRFRP